ncbi:hypothetical protein CT0861_08135 [Colletotrichum tofieldiae]|uniref:Uncharacterized protein n=1 Tax=Colletotrichum tofieldiae TaxID=708197 RepID=A0A166T242_9PEZI|nr:hypothetical protein CT0861_08135 [Colletotrichum tofieldiae]GKT96440.1 hypothetical protein Ct61P_14290 [Colletotrichum tofieldiae]
MSANASLIQAIDGQFYYYKADDGHWYPYSSLEYSTSSYATNQQYAQDPSPPQGSPYHGEAQYDQEEAEAGRRSFQGDQHVNSGDSRKGSSSARKQSEKRVTKYVDDQTKERRSRDEPHDNSRASRRAHKKLAKKNLEEILKPFKR